MRILILCYEYPPVGGGGGRVARSVGEEMVKRGHAARVQTAGMKHLPGHETINGVEVFRTESFRKREDTCSVVEMGLFLLTSFRPTLRHIRAWKPDVIHAHFAMPTGVLAWLANLLTGVPYVLTAHLGDVPGGVPQQTDKLFRVAGWLARLIWKKAAAATAVSGFVQELAVKAYRRPVVKILNGIRLGDEISDFRFQISDCSRPRHFVFLGRFNPQKSPGFAVDALATVADLPNWRFTMIGDGPLMPEVRERIAFHRLQDRVTLTGWLDTEAVAEILKRADVLLMPSLSEGMPVAAVEALKHGLAIVGSDIPGLYDVIDNGVNGYLVEPGNRDAFAHKLRGLLTGDGTLPAMQNASLKKAREFDLTRIVDQYEEVLLQAASPPRG